MPLIFVNRPLDQFRAVLRKEGGSSPTGVPYSSLKRVARMSLSALLVSVNLFSLRPNDGAMEETG